MNTNRRFRLTYANVIATIALFAALGGSSYAAVAITGQQVRDGSLTGRDVHDRTLLARDFKNGQLPAGPAGAKGDTGPAGPITGDLPSHVTLRGTFNVDFVATAAEQFAGGAISFGLRLPAKPKVAIVGVGGQATADCPGSLTSPEAAPGTLCVYESTHSNTARPIEVCDAGCNPGPIADRHGAELFVSSKSAGRTFIDGTWAVTAP